MKDQLPSFEFSDATALEHVIDKVPLETIPQTESEDNEFHLGDFSESDDEPEVFPKPPIVHSKNVVHNLSLKSNNHKPCTPFKIPPPVIVEDKYIHPFIEMTSNFQLFKVDESVTLKLPTPYACFEDYILSNGQPADSSSNIQLDPVLTEDALKYFLLEYKHSSNVIQSKETHIDTSFLHLLSEDSFKCNVSNVNVSEMPFSHQRHMHSNEKVKYPTDIAAELSSSFNVITADMDVLTEPNYREYGPLDNDELVKDLKPGFVVARDMINQTNLVSPVEAEPIFRMPQTPVIFATEAEKICYEKFTRVIPKDMPSDCIFQIDRTWIDKRTLALSMRAGCWFHKYAMSCFCKMFNSEQYERLKFCQRNDGEIANFYFLQETTELLMNDALIHSDFADCFRSHRLGVVLEHVDHVYIPCCTNNQWFLIVANFIGKTFDVLNPDTNLSACNKMIDTVTYNFKALFLNAYRHCTRFNIRDFPKRYVMVPKQKFRYDSGIFVLRFEQTFDGDEVQNISNADLLPLRQKLLFQLLACNEYILGKIHRHDNFLERRIGGVRRLLDSVRCS